MSMFLLLVIRIIHFIVVLAVMLGPFFLTNPVMLALYIACVICMCFHWWVGDDTCFLTLLESKITHKPHSETFIGRIVKPIYNVTNDEIIKATLLLLLIACCKLAILYMSFVKRNQSRFDLKSVKQFFYQSFKEV